LADVGVKLDIKLVIWAFDYVRIMETYGAARGSGGGLTEEARDGRTAGGCASVGGGSDARIGAVGRHGHHTRATGEVVAGGRSDL